jgi:DHA2 family multidrug resistance protein-like MFS transporter
MGGALGIAIFGSIGIAIYRGAIASALPDDVPVQTAHAASDTLGGALEVARQLSDGAGPALIVAARDAFTQGLHVAAGISAIAAVALAILVLKTLRHVGMASEPQEPRDPEQGGAIGGAVDLPVPVTSLDCGATVAAHLQRSEASSRATT